MRRLAASSFSRPSMSRSTGQPRSAHGADPNASRRARDRGAAARPRTPPHGT
jgi:hypothetical protein